MLSQLSSRRMATRQVAARGLKENVAALPSTDGALVMHVHVDIVFVHGLLTHADIMMWHSNRPRSPSVQQPKHILSMWALHRPHLTSVIACTCWAYHLPHSHVITQLHRSNSALQGQGLAF